MKNSRWEAVLSATKQAANAAVQVSKAVATEVVQGVVGAQCLLNYNIEEQVASCGRIWAIFSAHSKKEGHAPASRVSVWVLDKRALLAGSNSRLSSKRLDAVVELCRKEIKQLARLKHPSILRLVAPLEETRTQLVFLTEPVFASLADILEGGGHLPSILDEERRALVLSELEIKHGLLQIADALHFLHHDAGIIHRSVSPESIIISKTGAWKLAGFRFAMPLAVEAAGVNGSRSSRNDFNYSNLDPSILGLAQQPPMGYASPEIVTSRLDVMGAMLPSADVFSLALVTHTAITRQPLLPGGCSVAEYERRVESLSSETFQRLDASLASTLRQMLSIVPLSRPPIASFSGCTYFVADVLLRALKFLDTALQKDVNQRAALLRELPTMMSHFDDRIIRLIVLPALLQELRTPELQSTALQLAMGVLQRQEAEEFELMTMPAIKPLLDGANGEILLQLTRNAPLFLQAQDAFVSKRSAMSDVAPKLLLRALSEAGDAKCHEEALRQVSALADRLPLERLKRELLPAVRRVCLTTTSAAVRVAAFQTQAATAPRMDENESSAMLETAVTCLSVDKSAPTAMCILGLGDALSKKWGPMFTAEKALPALTPLLASPALSAQQFTTAAKTVHEMVGLIEKARGGEEDDSRSGPPAAGALPPIMTERVAAISKNEQKASLRLSRSSLSETRDSFRSSRLVVASGEVPEASLGGLLAAPRAEPGKDPAQGIWKSGGLSAPKIVKKSARMPDRMNIGAMKLSSKAGRDANLFSEDLFGGWMGAESATNLNPQQQLLTTSLNLRAHTAQDPFDDLALQHVGGHKAQQAHSPPSLL